MKTMEEQNANERHNVKSTAIRHKLLLYVLVLALLVYVLVVLALLLLAVNQNPIPDLGYYSREQEVAPVQSIVPPARASEPIAVPRRRLEFVHIPKTGGTAIESQAARYNLTWGICHFVRLNMAPIISRNETHCPAHRPKNAWPGRKQHERCPWWHVPPSLLEQHNDNPYASSPSSAEKDKKNDVVDLFTIVRNPYTRLLSEYYYVGNFVRNKRQDDLNDVHHLNDWIGTLFSRFQRRRIRPNLDQNITGNEEYWYGAGHFIPQYDFVFDHRRRIITHVLRFENLTSQLEDLMKQYHMPFHHLPTRRVLETKSVRRLGVANISKRNLQRIEQFYELDFREWSYPIVSSRLYPDE